MARKRAAPSTRKAGTRATAPAAHRPAAPRGSRSAKRAAPEARPKGRGAGRAGGVAAASVRPPRRDRDRTEFDAKVPTPPSSLDLDPRGSAARSGRIEMAEARRAVANMADVVGGDPDVNVEDAYFTGEEAPGGDNPTPDQDIVDEIGKALGLQYQDVEELDSQKISRRDRHRWELDPASAEDYKDRK